MNTATLRDVTVGEDTVYPFAGPPTGLGSLSRQSTTQRLSGGVAFTGRDVGEAGSLVFEVHVVGPAGDEASVMPLVDDLVAAWSPADDDLELELTIGSQGRVYVGRPLSALVSFEHLIAGALARAQLSFTVSDGRWRGATSKSASVTVAAAASGGMDTPMDTPMVTTGGGSTGDVTVVNDGSAPAPWQAFLTGPLTTPRLIMGGHTLTIDGTIPAGSTALLDSRDWSLLVDGAAYPWVTVESEWWEIPPGASTFSFRAAAGTGSALLMWRDASF